MSAGADPAEILRRVFGFPAFRGLQEPAVATSLAGGDALVLMPTGGGKSICYQVPALCRPGTAVVISPLIALMDDQVAALRQLGVAAAALHSDLDPEERARRRARSIGRSSICSTSRPSGCSPTARCERLRAHAASRCSRSTRRIASRNGATSSGPEYRGAGPARRGFSRRAAHRADRDRRSAHARRHPGRAADGGRGGVRRQLPSREPAHRRRRRRSARPRSCSASCAASAGDAASSIAAAAPRPSAWPSGCAPKGMPAVAFHAGLAAIEKRAALARFRSGEPVVVVATIAFGMGIDRPDVRFVVHLDMPDSPEAYYQQIGRAGRDGERGGHAAAVWRRGHRPGPPLAGAVRRARGAEAR